jgi:hypothetical protein
VAFFFPLILHKYNACAGLMLESSMAAGDFAHSDRWGMARMLAMEEL